MESQSMFNLGQEESNMMDNLRETKQGRHHFARVFCVSLRDIILYNINYRRYYV